LKSRQRTDSGFYEFATESIDPKRMLTDELRPLDLTLISRRFPPQIGGAEKVMRNYADAFAALGDSVTVLCSADPAVGIEPSTESASNGNPAVVRLPYSGIRLVGTAFYMRSLRKWLDRNRPGLIYVSMLKHDAYVATRWGRAAGVPVVLRPEGAGATGDMAWQRNDRFGPWIGGETLKADAFVALSGRIRDDLIGSGYDPGKIHVIPNGVPIPAQPWIPQGIGPPVVTFVGRLAFEKGLDRLLEAWPLLLGRSPGARLRLIGAGVESDALKGMAVRMGIVDSVEFAGASNDVEAILRQSDVFVLPSREEGLSIALLEAMALGMPVVVSDIPGNRTLVDRDVTGQIVEANDRQALAEALANAIRRNSAILKMAGAGRERVASDYSVRAAAIRHHELFRSLIDRKPTGRTRSG